MNSVTSLMAPRTGLSYTQFSVLIVLESLIPNDQKKYNNTEMKSGRLFTATTHHLTPAVVNIKILETSRSLESNQNKDIKIANPYRKY